MEKIFNMTMDMSLFARLVSCLIPKPKNIEQFITLLHDAENNHVLSLETEKGIPILSA